MDTLNNTCCWQCAHALCVHGGEERLVGRLWSHWEQAFHLCSVTYLLCEKRSYLFSDVTHSLTAKRCNITSFRGLAWVVTKPSLAGRRHLVDTFLHILCVHPHFLLLHRRCWPWTMAQPLSLPSSLQTQINPLSIFPHVVCVKITKTQGT